MKPYEFNIRTLKNSILKRQELVINGDYVVKPRKGKGDQLSKNMHRKRNKSMLGKVYENNKRAKNIAQLMKLSSKKSDNNLLNYLRPLRKKIDQNEVFNLLKNEERKNSISKNPQHGDPIIDYSDNLKSELGSFFSTYFSPSSSEMKRKPFQELMYFSFRKENRIIEKSESTMKIFKELLENVN